MRWFRLYSDVVNDPKVQKLDGETFKFWINILCITSENEGVLPSVEDIAFVTRCNKKTVTEMLHTLTEASLLTVTKNQHGEQLIPNNWKKRQFKSDSSAERVARHRERNKTVTCNVTETPPDTDTDTEQKTKKKTIKKEALKPDDVGQEVWSDFLQHRKAKKAPVTNTVINQIRKEAGKINWSLEDALAETCSRGWQGFKADWTKNDKQSNQNQRNKPHGQQQHEQFPELTNAEYEGMCAAGYDFSYGYGSTQLTPVDQGNELESGEPERLALTVLPHF